MKLREITRRTLVNYGDTEFKLSNKFVNFKVCHDSVYFYQIIRPKLSKQESEVLKKKASVAERLEEDSDYEIELEEISKHALNLTK